ncbi:MAG: ribonuclease T [Pseudomonadota bacterium]
MKRAIVAFCAALMLGACEPASETSKSSASSNVPIGSGFGFYVLALSWSPGYCRSQGDRGNRQQCGDGTSFEWVVHGLWPQFERGFPEFCGARGDERVPRALGETLFDIMPSMGLIGHQWRKHGSCSGLTQDDYFDVTRAAFDLISKPDIDAGRLQSFSETHDSIERAFLDLNPAMTPQSVGVTCDRRFLRDVRICLSKDLSEFVSCPEVDRRHCQLPEMVVVPAN